ncbi:MAG: DUF4332 domain-containing protein [Ardenticatenaceae bacterium]|nr:DUF4332 domain-containing protein [Ardenticatenaceae bacterium]
MEAVLIFIAGSAVGSIVVTWFSRVTEKLPFSSASQITDNPLKKINGIGPIYAARLQQAGIISLEQLAAASPDALYSIASGGRTNLRMDVKAWIKQAQQLTQKGIATT